jgi:hypothetical protein
MNAPAPIVTATTSRLIVVATWDWQACPDLRTDAESIRSGSRGSMRLRWQRERTTTWTTVEAGSEAWRHVEELAARWAPRGVLVLDLATDAPLCVGCGCVEEIACGLGCSWSTRPPRDPWICTSCASLVIRPQGDDR